VVGESECAVDRGDLVATIPLRRVVPGIERQVARGAAEDVRRIGQRPRLGRVRDEVGVEPIVVPVPAREQCADERPGRGLVASRVDDVTPFVPRLSALRPAASLHQHCRSRIPGCL
jgi:hypothetical protein